jgi:hypothetical protein
VEVVRLHLDDARLIDRQGHVGGPRRIREDLLRGGVHVDLAAASAVIRRVISSPTLAWTRSPLGTTSSPLTVMSMT